jgi:S1-C subfamily serine protease
VEIQLSRNGFTHEANLYDDHYPEVLQLHVRRAKASDRLRVRLTEIFGHGNQASDISQDSHVVVKGVSPGPFEKAGILPNDVVLAVQNHFVCTVPELSKLVQGLQEFDVIVKRMASSKYEQHPRQKSFDCRVDVDAEVGLGLNLQEIQSGQGKTTSLTYIFVRGLTEHSNGKPGPSLLAGVRNYDLLLAVNDNEVYTIRDVQRQISNKSFAKLTLRRMVREYSKDHPYHPCNQHAAQQFEVNLHRNPGQSLGVTLTEAYTADSGDPFLVVQRVGKGTPAYKAGILFHDIFWQVDGHDIFSLSDLKKFCEGRSSVTITIRRHDFE